MQPSQLTLALTCVKVGLYWANRATNLSLSTKQKTPNHVTIAHQSTRVLKLQQMDTSYIRIHVCRDIDTERGREKGGGGSEREKQTFVHGISSVPLVLRSCMALPGEQLLACIGQPSQPGRLIRNHGNQEDITSSDTMEHLKRWSIQYTQL